MNYGPKIVTRGLVLALDAADRKSYAGSGTAWNDLSGKNNNGTLVNSPIFSSSNGGNIYFDAGSKYATFPSSFTNNRSISTYIFNTKFNSIDTSLKGIFGYGNNSTAFICNFRLSNSSDGAPSVGNSRLAIRALSSGGGFNNIVIGTTNIQANIIYNIAYVIAASSYKLYINGIEDTLTAVSGSNDGQWINAADEGISVSSLSIVWYNGGYIIPAPNNFYSCQFYNRALSASEILQNFNATRGRFGI